MATGVVEYMELEVVFTAVVMDVVAKEDMLEGAMIINHMNLPAIRKHLWQRPLYTLKNNVVSSPCNKIMIFNKLAFAGFVEAFTFPLKLVVEKFFVNNLN